MRVVRARRTFPGAVADAERCWYDTSGWPAWIDGLDRVVQTAGPWPQVGGSVAWESGPSGRGRVSERVVAYAPGGGQALEVSDDSVTGHQTVAFVPVADGVEVTLELQYQLNRSSPLTAVVDLLFIRRQMAQSLARTLERFGARLRTQRDAAGLP
jgi:Polyketide cyclase / dehydrase and lipid transport